MLGFIATLFFLALIVFVVSGYWKAFEKAGEPGWASIIPIYNYIVMLRIAGKPEWWIFLMFVPLVNIFVAISMLIGVARNFGQSTGFGLGLVFLGFIFWPILGYGDEYRYQPLENGYYEDRIDEFGETDEPAEEDDNWNPIDDRRNV